MNIPKLEYLNSGRRSYGESEPQEYMVGFIPHRSGTYRIEIDKVIECVSQFSTAIQVLENAKEEDEIVIMLQCGGGSVNAGEAFIHAMRKCAAPIHIVATGGVHSMATCILLEADSLELSHGFNAVLHAGYDGAGGTVAEYRAKSKFDEQFRDRQFRETYEGFLSEDEMNDMLDGKDIWLDADGWLERALARSEYFKAKYEAQDSDAAVAEVFETELEQAMEAIEAELEKRKPAKPRKTSKKDSKKTVDNAA